MLLKLVVSASEKLRTLTDPATRDKGEGPVPHVVMIFIMASAAVLVGGIIYGVARGWANNVPTTVNLP
ncbi:hypothetical protein QEZ54_14080 [Catellatospora sp. KI3]|uniref:hypothetical protein n=1 Tax=Catellatospora sp. KI3 TaxID=3041620 RepID=UPI0024823457|nr:hypothetical protein [Catellatospora sp. KI3]MDI1462099.1 hypothetical protein [Catellatospora sp. KI3]